MAVAVSYNKLWKLLIDKEMTKMQLQDAAGISATSIAKLGKGGNITTVTPNLSDSSTPHYIKNVHFLIK